MLHQGYFTIYIFIQENLKNVLTYILKVYDFLGCNTMFFGECSKFRKNESPPSSGSRSKARKIPARADGKLRFSLSPDSTAFMPAFVFNPEYGNDIFLRSAGRYNLEDRINCHHRDNHKCNDMYLRLSEKILFG